MNTEISRVYHAYVGIISWNCKVSCMKEMMLTLPKGHFPLGGIFGAEWYFLLSFDAHSPPIGL